MLVPLSWLRDFAPFPTDDPVALGEVFDSLGMVVEGIRRIGEGLDGVVVAHVLEVGPHPNADKVRLCQVDAGDGEPLQIVCGAANVAAGQKVALAKIGAVLPGEFEIARRKVRGEWSNGMICSAVELALGEESDGTMVLPDGLVPGTPFADAMGIETDVVYDLAIETNRPDALSIVGVARDAAAKMGLPFTIPSPPELEHLDGDPPALSVDASDLCPIFTATVLTGVTVGPSPEWMARRLTMAGMRPINNLVDISNYVMLELGQPTHPYDLEKLPGGGLSVRRAEPGETITTLDDVERRLTGEDDCLICDATGSPVGIAGVMGGATSEISDSTKTVVLEAAWFRPMAIAWTAKRVGLRSEASVRFERGVDAGSVDRAVARFCQLAAEIAGATVGPAARVVDAAHAPQAVTIPLRIAKVNSLLGSSLTRERVAQLLTGIGFKVSGEDDVLTVTVPLHRPDVNIEVDLIEEVARHHGYDNIERSVPRSPYVGQLTPYQRARRYARDVLCGAGLDEASAGPLIGPGDHERAGLSGPFMEASDPLVREESILRISLRPGLLRALAHNASHRAGSVALFEMGDVFPLPADPAAPLPDESERLAAVLSDRGGPDAVQVLRLLADALGLTVELEQLKDPSPGLHPARTAEVRVKGEAIGVVGEIDPAVVAAWDLEGRVGWIDVELQSLLPHERTYAQASPVSRYPSSDVDLAFIVDEGTPAGAVERSLRESGGVLLVDLHLFDVYRAPDDNAKRSVAFRLRFNADDHTLTADEVAAARQRCIDAVESHHPATLRA